jgi:hypothetical protein
MKLENVLQALPISQELRNSQKDKFFKRRTFVILQALPDIAAKCEVPTFEIAHDADKRQGLFDCDIVPYESS